MCENALFRSFGQCTLHRNTLNTVSGSMAHTAAHEHLWPLSTYVVRHTVYGMGSPAPPDVCASAFPNGPSRCPPSWDRCEPSRRWHMTAGGARQRSLPTKKAHVDRLIGTRRSMCAFAQSHSGCSAVNTHAKSPFAYASWRRASDSCQPQQPRSPFRVLNLVRAVMPLRP
jgi:hypothetical protein